MTTYKIAVETENNVAGNRRHGAIYPMFSASIPRIERAEEGENYARVVFDKITIEDGQFERASRRIGYTGQHCDIVATIKDGWIETSSPYIEGSLYSRNKYGSTNRRFRLNLASRCLERPVIRGGVTRWYPFTPKQYID